MHKSYHYMDHFVVRAESKKRTRSYILTARRRKIKEKRQKKVRRRRYIVKADSRASALPLFLLPTSKNRHDQHTYRAEKRGRIAEATKQTRPPCYAQELPRGGGTRILRIRLFSLLFLLYAQQPPPSLGIFAPLFVARMRTHRLKHVCKGERGKGRCENSLRHRFSFSRIIFLRGCFALCLLLKIISCRRNKLIKETFDESARRCSIL